MKRLYARPDDFEGVVRILTEREGGRHRPLFNGIRWDLRYFHQEGDGAWMVWPEFIDEVGDMIPEDVPIIGFVRARFYIISDQMRSFTGSRRRPASGSSASRDRRSMRRGSSLDLPG
jgi:hypothetical protein